MATTMDRVTSPRFVGRAEPLARLRSALDRAGEGLAGVFLVGGEAGVGKTRLVGEVVDHARRSAAAVLAGGCVDLGEVSLPYAPVVEALRTCARERGMDTLVELAGGDRAELARLLPELADRADGPDPAGEHASSQARLFDLVLRLLERLSAGVGGEPARPVLLVLEDLHWADRSTLDLLTFLARNLNDCGVLLVATYRSDELHRRHPLRPVLAELERSGRVDRTELPRFDRDEVVEQLTGILGEPPSVVLAEDVWCRSEGNAFFVEELVAAARHGTGRSLPPTLRDILIARLEHLPESAQHVLRVAAAAGYRVDHRLLAAVAGLPIAQLLEALRLAVTSLVLIPDDLGEAYTFRHALVQEALYGELLPGERTALHTAFAEAITARPELVTNPAAALAHHWYRAHEPARALPAAVRAGDDAKHALAFAEAQRHFERALGLWEKVPEAAASLAVDRVTLLARASVCAFLAGDTERAHALVGKAVHELDPDTDPRLAGLLYARLGRYRWLLGRAGAFEAYERALALVPGDPSPERARVLGSYGAVLMLAGRHHESRQVCEEAIEVARRVGARNAEADALNTFGVTLVEGFGEADEGLSRLREALAIAQEAGGVDEQARAWNNLAAMLGVAGRHDEAYEVARDGAEAVARLGIGRSDGAGLRAMAADALIDLGRWDEAQRMLPRMPPVPMGAAKVHHTMWTTTRLQLLRGDFDGAASTIEDFRRLWGSRGGHSGAAASYLAAELALWQRRPEDALRSVEAGLVQAEGDCGKLTGLLPLGLWAAADLAEQARARGDEAGAAAAVAAGERLRETAPITAAWRRLPGQAAKLAEADAEYERLHGRADPERYAALAERWDALGDVLHGAFARWRQAEALVAARAPRERVVEPLVPALATARMLGAAPLAERLEALARRARVEVGANGGGRPAGAAGGLTPRETEVLALVAAGRSNRQIGEALFISTKTASVHVSNILAKLGVGGRAEAATAAWRLGLLDEGRGADAARSANGA